MTPWVLFSASPVLSAQTLPSLFAVATGARRSERKDRVSTEGVSDGELVDRARGGDPSAEEAIYRRHVEYVAGIAARILRSRTEAEDVVQETFIAVLGHLGGVRDGDALRAYLAQTVVRTSRRRLRRRRIWGFFSLDTTDDEVGLEAIASESLSAESRAELALLDGALLRLPTEMRIAWTLRLVEGLSLEEVADACRCSLATAKRRIAAASAEVGRHVTIAGQPPKGSA